MFSVIVPTKNRPDLVRYAIQSAINQDDVDVEVLVIDNGDSTEAVENANFSGNPQIKHFRTGGLSMADNWEYGLEKASGDHVLFLKDRNVLRKGALRKIRRCFKDHRVDVVKWSTGLLIQESRDNRKFPLKLHNGTGQIEIIASEKIKKWYGSSSKKVEGVDETFVNKNLPICTKCCFTKDVIRKVSKKLGGRAVFPVAPDYSLGFALLGTVDSLAIVDEDLTIGYAQFLSNGRLVRQNNEEGVKTFVEETGGEVFYNHVSLKDHNVYNIIFNDYERMRIQGIDLYPLNPAKYYAYTYLEYWKSRRKHGVEISESLTSWQKTLAEEDRDVQKDTKTILRQYGHYFVGNPMGYRINSKKIDIHSRIKRTRKRIQRSHAKDAPKKKHYMNIENFLNEEFGHSLLDVR